MEKEKILQTLAEWRESIKSKRGTGIFGWNSTDEAVYQRLVTMIKNLEK